MKIPLFKIYHDREDIDCIAKVIKHGMSWATGPNIELFEKELANYVGTKYALTFNSGTSALHALMIYYGFKGEVIVPSFSFIATANAPLFVGATPVFAEIENETLGLDPEDVKKRITPKTEAIIAVHIGGRACKIEELRKIADDNKLILIEDACESLGSKIGERMVGTFGDAGVFSFCANKIISTGEGGAVVCNIEEMYDDLKLIRSHGRKDTQNFFDQMHDSPYEKLGYNWRTSNLLAALGRSQLRKIDKIIKMRASRAAYVLKKIYGIDVDSNMGVFQMLTIRHKERNRFQKYLNDNCIGARVYFNPIHLTDFYIKLGHKAGELPTTEQISKEVLSLPIYPSMTKKEMDYMIDIIKKFK